MPTASSAVDRWCQRHTLALFYVIAYAVSWSIAVPLALQAHGRGPFRVPLWMHYLTAFGPAAAALIVSVGADARVVSCRGNAPVPSVGPGWTLTALSLRLRRIRLTVRRRASSVVVVTWQSELSARSWRGGLATVVRHERGRRRDRLAGLCDSHAPAPPHRAREQRLGCPGSSSAFSLDRFCWLGFTTWSTGGSFR